MRKERVKKRKLSVTPDKYRPSRAEQQLLDVVLRPENFSLNVTEICQTAGVSRDTFYRVMKNPDFKKLLREETFNLIDPALPGVVNSFIKEAKGGSYAHGKVVLEMGNVYTPKAEFKGAITMSTTEELIEKLKTKPELVTEDERKRLGRLTGVVDGEGNFSLHLLLIEFMKKTGHEDTSKDWRFLLLDKETREFSTEESRKEIYQKLPGLREAEEKEDRERKDRESGKKD